MSDPVDEMLEQYRLIQAISDGVFSVEAEK